MNSLTQKKGTVWLTIDFLLRRNFILFRLSCIGIKRSVGGRHCQKSWVEEKDVACYIRNLGPFLVTSQVAAVELLSIITGQKLVHTQMHNIYRLPFKRVRTSQDCHLDNKS